MKTRFIDRNGKEQMVDSLGTFIAAVRDGELSSDTLVFDEQGQRWKKASELANFSARTSDDLQTAIPITETPPASCEKTPAAEIPATPDVGRNGEDRPGWRTAVWRWVFGGPTLYAVTLGLSYALVQNSAPLVRDESETRTHSGRRCRSHYGRAWPFSPQKDYRKVGAACSGGSCILPLLSGYNSNRFNWLAETTKPSWESGGWSACKMGVFSKSVTLKICRIW